MAEVTVWLPDDVTEAARELGVDLPRAVAPHVREAAREAVLRAGGGRRRVTVTAVVMAGDSQLDIEESYAVVARALLTARRRSAGARAGGLVPIEYPLVSFEANSEPFIREPS